MKITEYAYAKLNLTLDVGERRADGYHELRSVMTSATLCDTLTVEKAAAITMECDRADLPIDGHNLAVKAAQAFFTARGMEGGCHIRLKKQIPSEAGLGGGSSDAAAVLRALRRLYAPDMPEEELERIGAQVGSDVPYCVRGGTVLCEGRGERLTTVAAMPHCFYVIVKPQEAFSTGKMYAAIDEQKCHTIPTTDELIRALERGDLTALTPYMCNTFSEVVPPDSDVHTIRATLLRYNALQAMMSGSGSAVFGIFDTPSTAEAAYEALKKENRQVFFAESV